MSKSSQNARHETFQLIGALLLFGLMLLVLGFIIGLASGRLDPIFAPPESDEALVIPTRFILPTLVTETPSPTSVPSLEAIAIADPTNSPIPTNNLSPTPTPSLTFTPTLTATEPGEATPTPIPTNFTATPTAILSPFPFRLDAVVRANPNNCNYQGFRGTVLDLAGNPIPDLRLVVMGPGLPSNGLVTRSRVQTADDPALAPISIWEAQVSNRLNPNPYSIELQDESGAALAPRFDFSFTGSCSQNLVYINYVQERVR